MRVLPVSRLAYEVEAWGTGVLYAAGGLLVEHESPAARAATGGDPDARVGALRLGALAERLQAYFAGERVRFDDVEVDLDWCTPLQADLAAALRRVPYGETVSYGELAALAGRPRAPRAAGTFCAGCATAVILPCHRVVASAGIGSYGSLGVDYKRRLLALEGVDAL